MASLDKATAKALQQKAVGLLGELIDTFSALLKADGSNAATLNAVRQFLKDNNITVDNVEAEIPALLKFTQEEQEELDEVLGGLR